MKRKVLASRRPQTSRSGGNAIFNIKDEKCEGAGEAEQLVKAPAPINSQYPWDMNRGTEFGEHTGRGESQGGELLVYLPCSYKCF